MEKRSTVTNLAIFTQFITESMDKGNKVDTIFLDFQKAFDQMDHFILLEKLDRFGFSNNLLWLFKSYLCNRIQYVRYRNFLSKGFSPTSGTPQGSNLGPFLFLSFINDISSVLTCEHLLYPDDLKIFSSIKTEADCVTLQDNLNFIIKRSMNNRLQLNLNKFVVMYYSRKHFPINEWMMFA